MSDWLYDGRSPPETARLPGDDGYGGAQASPKHGRLPIPLLQLLCVAGALAIILTAPPRAAVLAWLLGAILVPLLWAWFYVEFKRREVGSDRYESEAKRRTANHVLLLVGLAVGMWGAFIFATEVAK